MRIVREDWLKIGSDDGRRPHPAFGDGPTAEYLPPRFGDAEAPMDGTRTAREPRLPSRPHDSRLILSWIATQAPRSRWLRGGG